jgi:hypothetical protein
MTGMLLTDREGSVKAQKILTKGNVKERKGSKAVKTVSYGEIR